MKSHSSLFLLLVLIVVSTSSLGQQLYEKRPEIIQINNHHFEDSYSWLSNTKNTMVLKALRSENQYFESTFSFENELSKEIRKDWYVNAQSHLNKTNNSDTLNCLGKTFVWVNPATGGNKSLLNQKGDTVLNFKTHFNNKSSLRLKTMLSPSRRFVSVFSDTTGNQVGTIEVFDLHKESFCDVSLTGVTEYAEWSASEDALYYVKPNKQSGRYEAVYKWLVTENNQSLVYFHPDLETHIYPNLLSNGEVTIASQGSSSFNQYLIVGDTIEMLQKDQRGVFTELDCVGDTYYVKSNFENNYSSIYAVKKGEKIPKQLPIIEGKRNAVITDFFVKGNYLVVKMNNGSTQKIWVYNISSKTKFEYPSIEAVEAFDISPGAANSKIIELTYYPATGPFEYHYLNLETHEIVKSLPTYQNKEVLNEETLASTIVYATSDDGVKIPVSLVYKKGLVLDGHNPVELEAYGAYGSLSSAGFTYLNWPFLNSGGIVAYAHVRGGGEYGKMWRAVSMNGNKMVSINDLDACAKRLIELKYTQKGSLFLYGGSAGGVVVAGAFAKSNTLYGGMCIRVPFLDVVNTMSDSLLPGVRVEYDEWGNPWKEPDYLKMNTYDPYRNMVQNSKAPVLIFSNLKDSRVMSWEAHKYVARFREKNIDGAPIYLKTYMNGGHFYRNTVGEAAVRYSYWMDIFDKQTTSN